MKKSNTIIAAIVVAIIALGGIYFMSISNTCSDYETNIEGSNEQMVNVRTRVKNVITGEASVVEYYGKLIDSAFVHANDARYGDGGSKAVMQFITEQNPNISPELFTRLQQAIESNWVDFEKAQTTALDNAFHYKRYLRRKPNGVFAGWMGYPTIDMAKYTKAVGSKDARKAIDTREDDGVDVFK